jgi:hypothetical protein
MENNTLSYREIGGWLMVIFIVGVLNASGDVVILLAKLAEAHGINLFFVHMLANIMPFSHVFANETLFFIAMPLTLFCNIVFLVCIGIRKLLLFKLFFFAACTIALVHLLFNAITMYPRTIFDSLVSVNVNPLADGLIKRTFSLAKKLYPAFLFIGTVMIIGVLFSFFLYFKRSKRISVYFDS